MKNISRLVVIDFIKSKNPFWNENGKIIVDPDGFGIIISNLKTL
ncbi:hypothetical protein [Flavobacterium sp.]